MRFALHSPQSVGAIKIDWDAPVEPTPAIREAMAPHDVDEMHAGVVLRGFVAGGVTYPRGTIAFRVGEGHELFQARSARSLRSTGPAAWSASRRSFKPARARARTSRHVGRALARCGAESWDACWA